METKTTRFLTQFSRAVFQQWVQSPQQEEFWNDEAFIHTMFEEAVAKLPHGKLQIELLSNLTLYETQFVTLIQDLHGNYMKKKETETWKYGALLNEEAIELELGRTNTVALTEKQKRLAGVLALDIGIDLLPRDLIEMKADVSEAEKLAELVAIIAARKYETPLEQKYKQGLVLKHLAVCAQKLIEKVCFESSNWSCGHQDQVTQLRALLERVVAQDVVALASISCEKVDGCLKAPWTMFYRPEGSRDLRQVLYDSEVAKIYGVLLTLAVYFPIDNTEEEETSNESSSSDDEKEETRQQLAQKQISALAQAQLTTRQVLLAAQMRQRGLDQNNQWLVSVLSFVQSLHKPATYLDEDGDEMLDTHDRCALLDCVGNLYTRVFANTALFDQAKKSTTDEKTAVQDRLLFEAVVCLRHAAHFMRVERKSSLPAITTAMALLAGVHLPASFVSWLDSEQTANPTSLLEQVTQRLWKKCTGQNGMANLLLSSTEVSDEEMCLMKASYLECLDHNDTADKTRRQVEFKSLHSSAESDEKLAENTERLFYMDTIGGDNKEKTSKSKRKRAKKKKKNQLNKSSEEVSSLLKRSRASSNEG